MVAGRGDANTGKHSSRRCVKSLFEPLFVEAVTQKGAKAVLLRLDVGESAGFVAFRDEVVAALDSEWKASSFDYLVNNAGFLQMALFEDTYRGFRWRPDVCRKLMRRGTDRIGRSRDQTSELNFYSSGMAALTPAKVFRALVDHVPEEAELAIMLRGDLASILRFAANKQNPDVLSEAGVLAALLSQESVVAGTPNTDWRAFRPCRAILRRRPAPAQPSDRNRPASWRSGSA
jgi:hypothetical protein